MICSLRIKNRSLHKFADQITVNGHHAEPHARWRILNFRNHRNDD